MGIATKRRKSLFLGRRTQFCCKAEFARERCWLFEKEARVRTLFKRRAELLRKEKYRREVAQQVEDLGPCRSWWR